jgi:hypothetical protein
VDAPYDDPECQPPPPGLPDDVRPAGPDDADAVEGITAAYRTVFEPPPDDVRGAVAGGDQLDDAFFEKVREGAEGYGIEGVTVRMGDVGFFDSSTALVVFDLEGAPVGWMYGEAVLVDGDWKMSAQTWCSLVGRIGAQCPTSIWDPDQGTSRREPGVG